MIHVVVGTAIGTVLFVVYLWYGLPKRNKVPLPPGPKKLPIIGNLTDMPTKFEWLTYNKWAKEYNSDIIHLDLAGVPLIVLNSRTAAVDLLDKRSAIYSSRPKSIMIHELIDCEWMTVTMPYGEKWKTRRRLFQQYLHPSNANIHQPKEAEYAQKMLLNMLDFPDDFMRHTRQMVGAIAISLAYGIQIRPFDDPHIRLAEKAGEDMVQAGVPGAFLVDTFPWLKYVPESVPGAGFQRKAREWRDDVQRMLDIPFASAKREISLGTARPSFTSTFLENVSDEDHEGQLLARDLAGQIFTAGADTTIAALDTFVLAMVCFPEIQEKAKRQLDNVVRGRLPEHGDIESLPYISALVKEVLRWQPVVPNGVPHYLTEDDTYQGYHIPKNSIVIANSWAMLHNEEDYPQPAAFNPERFLSDDGKLRRDVKDPYETAFGFGRRICPGSHIAISTLSLTIAYLLATFDISKAIDEENNVVEPSMEYCSGIVCRPQPFKCSIKPRSKDAELLVRAAAENHAE